MADVSAFPADDIWDAIMREFGSRTGQRLEIHNTSVDERVAEANLCGHVHLPTGRTCVLQVSHAGSCTFEPPERAHQTAQRKLGRA